MALPSRAINKKNYQVPILNTSWDFFEVWWNVITNEI